MYQLILIAFYVEIVSTVPRGSEHGEIFILQNMRSKIGHLLHKSGHFDSDLHTTVSQWAQELHKVKVEGIFSITVSA